MADRSAPYPAVTPGAAAVAALGTSPGAPPSAPASGPAGTAPAVAAGATAPSPAAPAADGAAAAPAVWAPAVVPVGYAGYVSNAKTVDNRVYPWPTASWQCPDCSARWTFSSGIPSELILQRAHHQGGQTARWPPGQSGMCPRCNIYWQQL